MKKIVLIVLLVCLLSGCAPRDEAIVGQWVYENGNHWYLILDNGDVFPIDRNVGEEYITSAPRSWYKEDGEYYLKINSDFTETLHIDGDTLVFGDSIYEWYRVPEDEWISLDEIYYSTFDEENVAYVQHPLSELIEE